MRRVAWILALGLLVLARGGFGASFEVHLIDRAEAEHAPRVSRAIQAESPGEQQLGPFSLGPLEASLRLVVEEQRAARVAVELHAMSRTRADGRSGWKARRFQLEAGEAVELEVPRSDGRYAFLVRLVPEGGPAALPVKLLVRVVENGQAVRERLVTLSSEPTRVLMTSGDEVPLSLTLSSNARSVAGARVSLGCAGQLAGPSETGQHPVESQGSYDLAWGDVLRIAGLEGPHGAVLLDLVVQP